MAHEFSRTLQKAGWVWEGCALEKPDVDVRCEGVDIGERYVAEAGSRGAIVEKFADFVSAVSHDFKPSMRDRSKFAAMLFQPCIDGGNALESAIESQEVCPRLDSRVLSRVAIHRELPART